MSVLRPLKQSLITTGLMEEKGIKTEGATMDPDAEKPAEASPSGGEKVSKMAKLKEKMHIGGSK